MHDTRQEHESFVSMDVKVGSWSNPAEYPGLAHFLEHMLFQATATNIMDFLSSNGGHTNAYTSFENTNYFYSTKSSSLKASLSIFGEMFSDPVLR